ncbi:MAG: zeta toxin family protein [Clostridiales bacterium]|jgi:UDP-N-acetylglucosamine kinase|nr:zeta toxin family protein [Clostridiales bacterium]
MNEKFNDYSDAFTAKDVKAVIEDKFETLTEDKIPAVQSRIVIFMGGLPGAGKSNSIEDIKVEYKKNIIAVDIDEYRKDHPKSNDIYEIGEMPEIKAEEPSYYSIKTNKFARRVSRGLLKKLREAGYNVIIDGTLRSPRYAIRAARIFKKKGYASAIVEIIATDKYTAWNGIQERFEDVTKAREKEIVAGTESEIFPRAMGREYYDSVVEALPESISELYKSGEFERIRIVDRQNMVYYDSAKTPDVDPGEILRKLLEEKRSPTIVKEPKIEAK